MGMRTVAKLIPWIALAVLGCAVDGSGARANSSKAVTLTMLVRCDGCGETRSTLIDAQGRRDGLKDRVEVSEIPGCERQTEPGEASTDGEAGEAVTIFHIKAARGAPFRLLLETPRPGDAVISLTGAVDGARSCAADGGGAVAAGEASEWRVRWSAKGDSCVATIDRITVASSPKSDK